MRFKVTSLLVAAIILDAIKMASAADLAKAPPYTAPVIAAYNWAGFYVGGNIGYGWANSSDPFLSIVDGSGTGLTDFFDAGGFPITGVEPKGVIGGAQLGYNWQTDAIVVGLVADFQASGMKQSNTFFAAPPDFMTGTTTEERKIDWFGTVRGKVGWAMQNWLLYGTAGLAYGNVKGSLNFKSSDVPRASGSSSETEAGWAAGAGLEYGWGRWSFGVEYLYIDLGQTNTTMTFSGYPGAETDSLTVLNHDTINVVRALVNYRF